MVVTSSGYCQVRLCLKIVYIPLDGTKHSLALLFQVDPILARWLSCELLAHIMLIQEISAAGLFFLVWGLPNVFDGFPILGYNIWANSRLCFADLNTIEPREVEWQFSQSNSSSSCNRISYFLTLDLFQGMMQMDMACAIIMKMQWCQDLKINVSDVQIHKYANTKIHKYSFYQSCR